MKFAILGHLFPEAGITRNSIKSNPDYKLEMDSRIFRAKKEIYVSLADRETTGCLLGIMWTPREMMAALGDEKKILVLREIILGAILYARLVLDIDVVQLGALTTSVTSGGVYIQERIEANLLKEKIYVNHGDSFTAAIVCQTVKKVAEKRGIDLDQSRVAIVGAYGIIGEAVSQIMASLANSVVFIGRRKEKLASLSAKLISQDDIGKKDFVFTTNLGEIANADIIITATSHPTALLTSEHLKKGAVVVDVSQPANVSPKLCQERPDITRVDGGFVNNPLGFSFIPILPKEIIYACIAEVIMQALEEDKRDHVGSIDLDFLRETEKWAEKYGFTLNKLTNFGRPIVL